MARVKFSRKECMKITKKYTHLNGEEYLIVNHRKLKNEIKHENGCWYLENPEIYKII